MGVVSLLTLNIPLFDITRKEVDPSSLFRALEELSYDGITRISDKKYMVSGKYILGIYHSCDWYIREEYIKEAIRLYDAFKTNYIWKELSEIYVRKLCNNGFTNCVPSCSVSSINYIGY